MACTNSLLVRRDNSWPFGLIRMDRIRLYCKFWPHKSPSMPNTFPSREQGCGNRRLGYLRRLRPPPKLALDARLQVKHLRYAFEARLKPVCGCQTSSWLEGTMPIIKNRDAEIVDSEMVWPFFNFLGHQEKSVVNKSGLQFCCGYFKLMF